MATPSVAAMPPSALSVSNAASIDAVQGILTREPQTSLFVLGDSAIGDSVALSQTSRLLSSVAEITDAADAAEAGDTVDSDAVVQDAQRFVDSVNALSLDNQLATFTLDTVLDIAVGTPVAGTSAVQPAEPEAPGIDVVPVGDQSGTFILTLDTEELQNALETDAAEATNQLAALAVPLGNAVLQAEVEQQLGGGLGVQTTAAGLSIPAATATTPVVPDLTVENAAFRQALADTALSDIVDAVAAAASSPSLDAAAANPVPVPTATNNAPARRNAATPNEAATAPPGSPPETGAPNVPITAPVAGNAAAPVAVSAAVPQVEAAATLANLVTTSLEQIVQLASNPTVAGAVAAFQIPADDGSRGMRSGAQAAGDIVNPVAAIRTTETISPNLANSGDRRRDQTPNARVNQWLATRPGLV